MRWAPLLPEEIAGEDVQEEVAIGGDLMATKTKLAASTQAAGQRFAAGDAELPRQKRRAVRASIVGFAPASLHCHHRVQAGSYQGSGFLLHVSSKNFWLCKFFLITGRASKTSRLWQ